MFSMSTMDAITILAGLSNRFNQANLARWWIMYELQTNTVKRIHGSSLAWLHASELMV